MSGMRILRLQVHLAGEADKDQPADEGLGQYVRFYNLESREEGILWDTKPSYVIMYDPDMAFIRQLEVTVSPSPPPFPAHALSGA